MIKNSHHKLGQERAYVILHSQVTGHDEGKSGCLLSGSCLTRFLVQSKVTCTEVTPPTMPWVLLQQ